MQSVGQSVTLESDEQLYTQLAVQRVPSATGRDYTVLFLLTGVATEGLGARMPVLGKKNNFADKRH